jgi:nucleotide-binding universal stress UspA family protein
MYKKILVPLDGSKLAECALPYVEALAKGCDTKKVILVSVTERVQGYRAFEDPFYTLNQSDAVLQVVSNLGLQNLGSEKVGGLAESG